MNNSIKTKALLGGGRFSRLSGDCSGFLSRGYRKHPRLDLWGHEGCSYFLSARGQKVAHSYNPAKRAKSKGRGYRAPQMRQYENKACHILMGEIFYGERPTYIDRNGKTQFKVCHHLIEEPLNYCPENLLCWLTRSEHDKADARRRALEAIVPDGNLHALPYARLRELQDPRTMSDDTFAHELEAIKAHFTTMDKVDPQERIDREMNRHCEY